MTATVGENPMSKDIAITGKLTLGLKYLKLLKNPLTVGSVVLI